MTGSSDRPRSVSRSPTAPNPGSSVDTPALKHAGSRRSRPTSRRHRRARCRPGRADRPGRGRRTRRTRSPRPGDGRGRRRADRHRPPRELPEARPTASASSPGRQVYDLDELPEELIVVGSGVTGAEFASAYQALGSKVTLVSSRDRVLPGEDPDAATVMEDVFRRRGMNVMRGRGPRPSTAGRRRGRDAVRRPGDHRLALPDGRRHPEHRRAGAGGGRREADAGGHQGRPGVATSVPGVYAAGDCTGVFMLASVAAMQGRIAMYHALGDAVQPLRLSPSPPMSSPTRRSPRSATAPPTSSAGRWTPAASSCRCAATPGPRCRASATAS